MEGIFCRFACLTLGWIHGDADYPSFTATQQEGSCMNGCDEYAIKTLRYLDKDLHGQELEDFLSHLHSCAGCREHLEAERGLLATLHRSRPLYPAPAALRSRVSAAVAQASASSPSDRRAWHFFHPLTVFAQRFPGRRALVPAAIALALCLAFVPNIVRNVRAANYVEAAVAEHRSYIDSSLLTQALQRW